MVHTTENAQNCSRFVLQEIFLIQPSDSLSWRPARYCNLNGPFPWSLSIIFSCHWSWSFLLSFFGPATDSLWWLLLRRWLSFMPFIFLPGKHFLRCHWSATFLCSFWGLLLHLHISVYLWHIPIILYFKNHLPLSPTFNAICIFLLALALSAVSYAAIERPFLQIRISGKGTPVNSGKRRMVPGAWKKKKDL